MSSLDCPTTDGVARDVLELLLIYWDHRPMPLLLVCPHFVKECALFLRLASPDFHFLASLSFRTLRLRWRGRMQYFIMIFS